MITDFHTHTFPDRIADSVVEKLSQAAHIRPFTDARQSSLLASMQRAGIGRSVLLPVATSPRQVEKLNTVSGEIMARYVHPTSAVFPADETRSGIEKASDNENLSGGNHSAEFAVHPQVLLPFGAMHPDYPDWHAELARMCDLGLAGFKVHPVYQDRDIDDISYLRIFDRAAELGLIVVTHAGLDIGYPGVVRCSPKQCRRVCDAIGPFRFVLAHMGGWRNWEEVPELLSETGAYIDTAFSGGRITPLTDGYWDDKDTRMLNPEAFAAVIRAFGADHVLFGTDSPWADQKESLDFLRSLPLTPEELTRILETNAERLLEGYSSDSHEH